MSLSLQNIIDAARDVDSTFAQARVPNAVFARFLSRYQGRLIAKATEVRPGIISANIAIVFPTPGLPSVSPLSTIGAGTGTGLTVGANTAGVPYGTTGQATLNAPVGSTVELDFTNAIVYWPPTPVAAIDPTDTILTAFGVPGWTVNQFANGLTFVEITAGTDIGDRRQIVANDAQTITVSQPFAVDPDTTSMFRVVLPQSIVTNETAAVLALPAIQQRTSYLVNLSAQGIAYIDVTQPLVAILASGIQLPPYKSILDGTIYFTPAVYGEQDMIELTFVDAANRLRAMGRYNAYERNGQLFLIGNADDWQLVQSIDIRYVPESPPLTQLIDLFVLPDSAYDCLVAQAARFAAERVFNAQDTSNVDLDWYRQAAVEAEQQWLFTIGAQHRVKTSVVKEIW